MHIPPLDVAVYPIVTMSHGRHGISPRPSYSSPPNPTASPDFNSIQRVVRKIFRSSRISVQQVERLSGRLHQVYLARLADGNSIALKCPPPSSIRLLRHEQRGLETEAKVLDLLGTHTSLPVPQVFKHEPQAGSLSSPFLMTSYISGSRLSEFIPYLSISERSTIDRTLGIYIRSITSLAAPSFGSTHRVFSNRGFATWREAFQSLLESALRDAEDMLVTVPYDSIRYYVSRHMHTMNSITEPRLVPLNACLPENVLVDEQTRQVSGLVGFSTAVWGDPLMARVFVNASGAFFEGFGECPAQIGEVKTRQLIYTVYRAVIDIVAHYYRPQYGIDELEARRSLTGALNKLAQL